MQTLRSPQKHNKLFKTRLALCYLKNLSKLLNFGDSLRKRCPAMVCTCLGTFHVRLTLEQVSATKFSADGIHEVLTFMFFFSKCKCMPFAQRSKGALVHLAVSIQALAVVLSSCSVVIRSVQKSVNVSHVIKAAMNSPTLIAAVPGSRSGMVAMLAHYTHEIYKKNLLGLGTLCENAQRSKPPPFRTWNWHH